MAKSGSCAEGTPHLSAFEAEFRGSLLTEVLWVEWNLSNLLSCYAAQLIVGKVLLSALVRQQARRPSNQFLSFHYRAATLRLEEVDAGRPYIFFVWCFECDRFRHRAAFSDQLSNAAFFDSWSQPPPDKLPQRLGVAALLALHVKQNAPVFFFLLVQYQCDVMAAWRFAWQESILKWYEHSPLISAEGCSSNC